MAEEKYTAHCMRCKQKREVKDPEIVEIRKGTMAVRGKCAVCGCKVYGIIGGLHGFHDFDRLSPLSLICPCHCTQYKSEIKHLFPERCMDCGAGVVIELGGA